MTKTRQIARQSLVIGSELLSPSTGEYLEAIDPATGVAFATIPRSSTDDVDRAVRAAIEAQKSWARVPPVERSRVLHRVSQAILQRRDELARIETLDVGKPLTQAYNDVDVASRYFEFYAGLADKILGTTIPLGDTVLDYTVREPVGVSGQIVPWNYPLQIGGRGMAGPMAAGNAVVMKPAEDASMSLLRLAQIAIDAGVPPGVINVVTGLGTEAGAALATHPEINQLTFTGSVGTGISVARAAAGNIVPVVLELGGKCPMLVFEDADLDEALPVILRSAMQNAGQTCSAISRVIVSEKIHEEFIDRIAALVTSLKVGKGLDDPDLGPVISKRQLERIADFVSGATAAGADLIAGGSTEVGPGDGGYFYAPTVIGRVAPTMEIATEEVFGPVLSILSAADEDEAIAYGNGTRFGLVSGLWTRNLARAHRVARLLQSGQVFINSYGAGGGVELPFGGYKESGFGREKGIEGLNAYLQTKNVCVHL